MSYVGGKTPPSVAESVARQTALRDQRAQRLETALRSPDPASFQRLMALDETELWEHARDFFRHRRLEIDGLPRGSVEAARRFSALCAHPGLQTGLCKESVPVRGPMDGASPGSEMSMLDVAVRGLLKIAEGKSAASEAAGAAMMAAFGNEGLGERALIAVCDRAMRQEFWEGQPWASGFASALRRLEPKADALAAALFERLGVETVWRGEGLAELKAIGAPFCYSTARAACRRLCDIGSSDERALGWVESAQQAGFLSAELAGRLLKEPGVRGACKAALEAIELAGGAPEAARRGGLAL